jgi:hypothetical protein
LQHRPRPWPRRLLALLAVSFLTLSVAATPARADQPAWQGSVDVYTAGSFTTQPDWVTCVPTAVQIMRNMIDGTSDHSATEIKAWYAWGRTQTYMPYTEAGLDPLAWARLLSRYGAGPYVDRSFPTFDDAVSAAAYELRLTGKPIGLLVSHGGHAWVMNGFSAIDDTLTTPTFSVTAVRVTGPLYPKQQKNGYDMPPDTELTIDQLGTYFTVMTDDTNPVPWIGSWVIVAPLILDHPLSSYGSVSRLGGADRYAVAANVSAAAFPTGAKVVYIANGTAYADALAGSVAATRAGGPILLVSASGVPDVTAAELARLKPGRVVALGGPVSVPDAVLATARSDAGAASVSRLGGADRYAVAANVSAAAFPTGAKVVYIANGTAYADALAGSVAATRAGGPILLGTWTSLPDATVAELERLKPERIVILGGPASISDSLAGF